MASLARESWRLHAQVHIDARVERYLAELLAAARDVLGDCLVGAYAAGSVALGAYQPDRSDIDVALVCADELAEPQKRELVSRLRHEALPCPARGLELVVYRAAVAQAGSGEPGFEVELNTGPQMSFRETYAPAERPIIDGHFWYGLDRSILHQSGLALCGPPAAQAFADLSRSDLQKLLMDALSWWISVGNTSGVDAVLGACRSLVKFRDGMWLAKVDAGRRVIELAPDLIARSIAARLGVASPPAGSAVLAFQRRVLDEITAGQGARNTS